MSYDVNDIDCAPAVVRSEEIPNGVDVVLPPWFHDELIKEVPTLNADDRKRLRELTRSAIAWDRLNADLADREAVRVEDSL